LYTKYNFSTGMLAAIKSPWSYENPLSLYFASNIKTLKMNDEFIWFKELVIENIQFLTSRNAYMQVDHYTYTCIIYQFRNN